MKYFPALFKISPRRLHPDFPPSSDRTPFIYFLIKNKSIIYIGQSCSIRLRIASHNCYLKPDYIRIVKCERSKLSYYESRWIAKFNIEKKPLRCKMNIHPYKRVKSPKNMNAGAKPKHAFNSLEIGQKALLKGRSKVYPHQFINQFNRTKAAKLRVIRQGNRVFAERIS